MASHQKSEPNRREHGSGYHRIAADPPSHQLRRGEHSRRYNNTLALTFLVAEELAAGKSQK